MNITTTLAELDTYIRRLGDVHPEIKSVVIGDSEEILSLDRSKIEYPVLWVETPKVDWRFADNPLRYYDVAFVVMMNSPTDARNHQRYILDKTLTITEQILAKIRNDADENLIIVDNGSATSNPILGYGHDHDFGWRTTLRIRASMNSCAPSCLWPDVCPVGSLARFTWTNNQLGDFTNIVFDDASLPSDEAWVTLWTWQVGDGPIMEDKDPPPPNQGAGNYMFVTLTITLGDCVLTASALVYNNIQCGNSVPYLIDKTYC